MFLQLTYSLPSNELMRKQQVLRCMKYKVWYSFNFALHHLPFFQFLTVNPVECPPNYKIQELISMLGILITAAAGNFSHS